jgi:CheY-like chemotaxis protein
MPARAVFLGCGSRAQDCQPPDSAVGYNEGVRPRCDPATPPGRRSVRRSFAGRDEALSLIAVVDDLFFAVRIRETARQAGVHIDVVPAAKFSDKAADGADAVILDLSAPRAIDVLRSLKNNPATASARVVGYASHVATGTIATARAAGCDQVLARSAFTRQLPDLLRALAGPPSSR